MAQLAIKGHPTRGKEVIEILEMLGGKNNKRLYGECDKQVYLINSSYYGEITCMPYMTDAYIVFTLEEFLEKFPYKVMDKVIYHATIALVSEMKWDGREVVYTIVCKKGVLKTIAFFIQPYEEETMEIMEEGVYAYNEINCYHQDFADKVQIRLGVDYKIEVEDGKTYIVRKKPQYPKTYLECCRIIVAKQDRHYYYTKKDKEQDYPNEIRILDQLDHLRMLIICRDAYWNITGDWRPDWESSAIKYTIRYQNNNILKRTNEYINSILCFPTEEMRDAFYENFKDLIEQSKELL